MVDSCPGEKLVESSTVRQQIPGEERTNRAKFDTDLGAHLSYPTATAKEVLVSDLPNPASTGQGGNDHPSLEATCQERPSTTVASIKDNWLTGSRQTACRASLTVN